MEEGGEEFGEEGAIARRRRRRAAALGEALH
jgi:hypothetical protein